MKTHPDPDSEPAPAIEFGRFKLFPLRRELLADGRPVELGARAFDLLVALTETPGAVLSKTQLMARVWPGKLVEENSLEVQISALRKALGPDRDLVQTIAGRGYHFAGEGPRLGATTAPAPFSPPTNLPELTSELIGRDVELNEVADLVGAHRLVTLVGAGGIGKTRLSLDVARRVLPRFADGVWMAAFGSLTDPALVPATVAAALGLTLAGPVSAERVATGLGAKHVLLLLDTCEHVIEAAARMAEALLRASPVACVLATSREPLRAQGEYIYRVPPLEVPEPDTDDTDDVLRRGAVKLFVARARAAERQFSLDQHTAAIAGAICRRLDGIPLAIELAAARAAALGVVGLAARLDDRFRLLTAGHRTALPRHKTLRATLDWSYDLLPEIERVVLRRLAIFAGSFTLESATAIVGGEIADEVVDSVVSLVARSLLTADVGGGNALYRLLDTTRAYALEKLTQSGEIEQFARRHAEYHRDLLERAEAEWKARPTDEWPSAYARLIGDVRAALDWACSPSGDAAIGVALTVAAVPIWMHCSLIEECRGRVERALSSLVPGEGRDLRREMQLLAALGGAQLHTRSPGPEITAAWASALKLAERLDDTDYRLRALWGLWLDRLNHGEFRNALALAEQFSDVAARSADPVDVPIGERIIGLTLHYMGDQSNARLHFERMLTRHPAPVHRSYMIRFQFDQWVTARLVLATILWIEGYPDRAMRAVETGIDDAQALHHGLSLSNALAKACPVAILAGDLAAAERFVAMLLDHSARHGLASWHAEGRCFRGMLLIKQGDVSNGLQLLRTALDELWRPSSGYTGFLGELAQGLGRAGEIAEGLATIDTALLRCERDEERWCIAELLRVKGELMLLECSPNAAAAAEGLFLQGVDWARQQGGLSWELRCATSLASLWHGQAQNKRARKLLAPVYAQFSEGFGTADLLVAKALLETLA